jgi:hypothetical protein
MMQQHATQNFAVASDTTNRPCWPMWKIVLAYTVMTFLAAASVWFIDRRVHLLPTMRDNPSAAIPSTK